MGRGLGGEEVGRWGKECPVALAFYVVANQEGNLSKLGAVRTPSPGLPLSSGSARHSARFIESLLSLARGCMLKIH
jgi:hypothetical protein